MGFFSNLEIDEVLEFRGLGGDVANQILYRPSTGERLGQIYYFGHDTAGATVNAIEKIVDLVSEVLRSQGLALKLVEYRDDTNHVLKLVPNRNKPAKTAREAEARILEIQRVNTIRWRVVVA